MDIGFLGEAVPLYIKAAVLTLKIAAGGILMSAAVGLVCAVVRSCNVPVFSQIMAVYTELSRNTPLLIQLFFLYFALPRLGIKLSSAQCAVMGLTFLGGSYMSETFRGAIGAVSTAQIESAKCIGLTLPQTGLFVVLPQAAAVSVPGICANAMFLIKETSVFSAVALADLMFVAKDLIGLYYKTEECLILLVVSYFVLLLPVSVASSAAERRLRRAQFGY